MRAQAVSDEEVKILEENKYTSFVSNSSIRFTLEFKEMFMERKQQGIIARRIFKEAGYDVHILGTSRIKNLSSASQKRRLHPAACMRGTIHTGNTGKMQITAACPRKKQWLPCSARSYTCARSLSL